MNDGYVKNDEIEEKNCRIMQLERDQRIQEENINMKMKEIKQLKRNQKRLESEVQGRNQTIAKIEENVNNFSQEIEKMKDSEINKLREQLFTLNQKLEEKSKENIQLSSDLSRLKDKTLLLKESDESNTENMKL
jgi:predicted RNase H-like nuclease (RuvC/YqgF family)